MSPMLPADRYLASLLGITDEEYALFKAEVDRRAAEGPQPAVVAGIDPVTLATISLVLTVLSVGVTIAASFFKPRPEDNDPAQLKVRSKGGKSTTENDRYAPRYGFDSTQDIATLGSVIPVVYTNRETISGTIYGGVRVNTPLLWSQIQSFGGSQLLRAIFLIGEGPITAVDVQSFASGGNTLSSYDYGNTTANQVGSRMSIYGRYLSGALTTRIASSHYIYGRSAANDTGNSVNDGGADVYQIRRNTTWASDFCAAMRPNSQTVFGVYSLIGNDFGMKINPTIKPKVQAQLIPEGDDGDAKVKCTVDDVAWAQRRKMRAYYSSRSGLVSGSVGSVGSTITYKLLSSSDKNTAFSREIKTLTNVGTWSVSVTQVFANQSAGAFNKPINADGEANQKGKWKFEYDSTNETSLASRVGGTITSVTVDSNGKGMLYATVTFNTGSGLWDNDTSNEAATANLEALKGSKFKIKFTNPVNTGIEDDEEIEVKFNLKVRIKHSGRQKFKLTKGQIGDTTSTTSISSSTDGNGNSTTVINTSTTTEYIAGDLFVENEQYTPTFTVKNQSPVTGGTLSVTGNGTLSVNIALEFNAKTIHIEKCEDVAATVAGRQKAWDDAIIPGELYKIGSALAICTSRTDDAFVSEADLSSGSGTPVEATFTTVRAGAVTLNSEAQLVKTGATWLAELDGNGADPEWRNVATTDGHILRCAIASISTTRACAAVELGIRSRLGIRISNLCNFKDSISNEEADQRACKSRENDIVEEGSVLKVDNYQSNTLTTTVERYSFFSISYRAAGSTGAFTKLSNAYGIRSATQQNTFNYIQLNMPGTQQWEFQLEPYSGWEIRTGAGGVLYILDARLNSRVTVSEVGGITVAFNGESIIRSADTFAINAGRRPVAKGGTGTVRADAFDYSNGDRSYIDTWGKLAEAFVYEEVQSSATNGPEHEVVYINEIVPNTAAPVYDDLAILGVNIMSSVEWQQFNQFSAYITGGKTCRRLLNSLSTGASHLFPDILLDLLTNTSYGRGDLINDSLIDLTAFQAAAQWCYDRRYFFDGVLGTRVNLRQWAADTAATHLLIFGESDGKFFLRPALQFTAVTIKGLFTAGNIAENSFQMQYLDPEERDPIQVSVRYREERASTDLSNPGLFPVVREVLVRESSGSESDPVESIDMSDYCTNRQHAIDAAKYVIRMRRIPTHTVRFNTTHEGTLANLAPGDYIRVALDITEYDQFNNGVVTAAGALVSTKPLSDGSYNVIAWNGEAATPPYDATLAVSANGTQATPTGIVFTVKLPSTQVRTYQIERITPNDDGTFTLESVHMPTNASGVLELADGFDTAGNWVIEG